MITASVDSEREGKATSINPVDGHCSGIAYETGMILIVLVR